MRQSEMIRPTAVCSTTSTLRHLARHGLRTGSRSLAWLLDQVLPRHCIACGEPGGKHNLCPPCRAELPRVGVACRRCGIPLALDSDAVCGDCLKQKPPWSLAIAALDYRFPVDRLICRFKFNRDLASGKALCQELLRSVEESPADWPDLIIPVPLHFSRQFVRSFNQAGLVARYLGNNLQLPVRYNLLRRVRNTSAQSGLDAAQRKRNVRGAFRCPALGVRHVALVDDVLTTGTTLAECTRVLRQAGVETVSVWVIARARLQTPSR